MLSNSDQNVLPFVGKPNSAAGMGRESQRALLVVLHQENSTPGRVGNALQVLGYGLDIRRPRFGDVLPETLDDHAGAVIFGGPMSVNDADDYIRREIE
jgi:GMP synthase (glutamine-hydrolysing)